MRKLRRSQSFVSKALAFAGLWGACFLSAQEAEGFKPSGSPIIVLFADYTRGMGSDSEVNGVSLTRSRLGYRYQATPSLSAVSVLDINATQNGRGVGFHYAFVDWTWKSLSVDAGLVALAQFGVQEAFWGRRYIEKSFQDLNGFGPDSDLGVIFKYRFASWLEADAALVQGKEREYAEGLRMNRFALGATLRPLRGLSLRAYFDVNGYTPVRVDGGPTPAYKNQRSVALFAGYRNEYFSIGGEYNRQQAQDFLSDNDHSGLSFYGGLWLSRKFDLYARYDRALTQGTSPLIGREAAFIAGLEYHPVRQLQVSPNYRYLQAAGGEGFHFIGLNVGFSL
jgi:opacity protein-like surface antigen